MFWFFYVAFRIAVIVLMACLLTLAAVGFVLWVLVMEGVKLVRRYRAA